MNADFTVHEQRITVPKFGEPIYLLPFGDTHYGAPGFHGEKFDEFCEWAAAKKNAYFIGMGDYMDIGSFSEKLILNDRQLHEDTRIQLNELYKDQAKRFCKKIEFMRGKIIAMAGGNHAAELLSGVSVDQYLCDLLNCKFMGTSGYLFLILNAADREKTTKRLDVWLHHGKGGGSTVGAPYNTLGKMAENAEAHIYLMGHTHTKGIVVTQKLVPKYSTGRRPAGVSYKKQYFISTGSFLKAYEDGKPSYVARRALRPSDLGTAKIEVTLRRKHTSYDGKDSEEIKLDYHASV